MGVMKGVCGYRSREESRWSQLSEAKVEAPVSSEDLQSQDPSRLLPNRAQMGTPLSQIDIRKQLLSQHSAFDAIASRPRNRFA